jgi:hypothetical protein
MPIFRNQFIYIFIVNFIFIQLIGSSSPSPSKLNVSLLTNNGTIENVKIILNGSLIEDKANSLIFKLKLMNGNHTAQLDPSPTTIYHKSMIILLVILFLFILFGVFYLTSNYRFNRRYATYSIRLRRCNDIGSSDIITYDNDDDDTSRLVNDENMKNKLKYVLDEKLLKNLNLFKANILDNKKNCTNNA